MTHKGWQWEVLGQLSRMYGTGAKVGQSEYRTEPATGRGIARNVFTPWGIRSVEITGPSDTAWTTPARLQLSHNGKRYNVPGFLTVKTDDGTDCGNVLGLQFHGNTSYVQELPAELQRGK